MNHNHETGSTQAAKARTENKINPMVDDQGKPLLSAEQHRQLKHMEALQERARIERLRKENAERIAAERRAFQFDKPKIQPPAGEGTVF